MAVRMNESFMRMALELAELGWGKTNPNPLVGAVIVKNGEIIGKGYHEAIGSAHAEIVALNNATKDVKGGTLYVNLEPCSHYGRTPPCAEAIIRSGISEVIIGMEDPNPKVSGKGITMLREAGINVTTGVLADESMELNEIFIKYITQKLPFVMLKSAMTLDGKISSENGDSKWISGEASRTFVHKIRDRFAAIMVGINTVIMDDPSLTTRLKDKSGKDPVRIIVDTKGKIPFDCKALNSDSNSRIILATTAQLDSNKESKLLNMGVDIIKTDVLDDGVDLKTLMTELYKREIDSVLLEGGGTLNAAALKAEIVDKIMMFIAPKIIGGKDAKTPVEGTGIPMMMDAIKLKNINIKKFDEDLMIEGYLKGDTCLQV